MGEDGRLERWKCGIIKKEKNIVVIDKWLKPAFKVIDELVQFHF